MQPSASASAINYLEGNRLELLKNGEQFFPALVRDIDGAQREVFLESYIFADDDTGMLVAEALARAAGRGVATHLLIDGFGTADFPQRARQLLAGAGVEMLVFRPSLLPWFLRRPRAPLRRMHRKLASIDGRWAFVGGINIIDDVEAKPAGQVPPCPRYDYAVRIQGPLVRRVRDEAERLWMNVSWATFGRRWAGFLRQRLRRRMAKDDAEIGAPAGAQRAALVIRDNIHRRQSIENAYLELISGARKEILIANAYFFPTRRFRQALYAAVKRGVEVTLLLQGRVEYLLQHYASRAHYRRLLAAGVRIHEYHSSFLHAKVAVFDGRMATVGSSNIDPFSLLLAQEANIFVDDEAFAKELRTSLVDAMRLGARSVPRTYWRRLSWPLRLRIWVFYRFARMLMAFFGFERLK